MPNQSQDLDNMEDWKKLKKKFINEKKKNINSWL